MRFFIVVLDMLSCVFDGVWCVLEVFALLSVHISVCTYTTTHKAAQILINQTFVFVCAVFVFMLVRSFHSLFKDCVRSCRYRSRESWLSFRWCAGIDTNTHAQWQCQTKSIHTLLSKKQKGFYYRFCFLFFNHIHVIVVSLLYCVFTIG